MYFARTRFGPGFLAAKATIKQKNPHLPRTVAMKRSIRMKHSLTWLVTLSILFALIFQPTGTPESLGQSTASSNKAASKKNVPFAEWLRDFIPAVHAGTKIDDHGHWFQARVADPSLVISWSEIPEDEIELGKVHGLRPGKSLFIAKDRPPTGST